jgi:hypothetical protein
LPFFMQMTLNSLTHPSYRFHHQLLHQSPPAVPDVRVLVRCGKEDGEFELGRRAEHQPGDVGGVKLARQHHSTSLSHHRLNSMDPLCPLSSPDIHTCQLYSTNIDENTYSMSRFTRVSRFAPWILPLKLLSFAPLLISSSNIFIHVFLGLPLGLLPAISIFVVHLLTQPSLSDIPVYTAI